MRHIAKSDLQVEYLDVEARHHVETAYRRGVQQALFFAFEELTRAGLTDAAAIVRRMECIAGEMRRETSPHRWYLDRLIRRLHRKWR